ncbi:MAG TPA: hypothetical protein VFL73_04145 [Solirubrobacteraceae bacterium]|nr:hypothetical protein [Solirubrobacteraceae bacterium]
MEEIDLVASAGPLDNVVIALREFIHRSGALRVVAVTPDSMVDCPRLAPIEVTTQGSTVALPHAIELEVDDPIVVPDVVQPPPFEVDPAAMEVRSPIGVLQAMGDAVRALAHAIGPTVVVMATFPTLPPEHALSITARGAEPLVYALGEELFELPE